MIHLVVGAEPTNCDAEYLGSTDLDLVTAWLPTEWGRWRGGVRLVLDH